MNWLKNDAKLSLLRLLVRQWSPAETPAVLPSPAPCVTAVPPAAGSSLSHSHRPPAHTTSQELNFAPRCLAPMFGCFQHANTERKAPGPEGLIMKACNVSKPDIGDISKVLTTITLNMGS